VLPFAFLERLPDGKCLFRQAAGQQDSRAGNESVQIRQSMVFEGQDMSVAATGTEEIVHQFDGTALLVWGHPGFEGGFALSFCDQKSLWLCRLSDG